MVDWLERVSEVRGSPVAPWVTAPLARSDLRRVAAEFAVLSSESPQCWDLQCQVVVDTGSPASRSVDSLADQVEAACVDLRCERYADFGTGVLFIARVDGEMAVAVVVDRDVPVPLRRMYGEVLTHTTQEFTKLIRDSERDRHET